MVSEIGFVHTLGEVVGRIDHRIAALESLDSRTGNAEDTVPLEMFTELENKVEYLDVHRIGPLTERVSAIEKAMRAQDGTALHSLPVGARVEAHASRLAFIEIALKDLSTLLLGDQEQRAKYEDGKARNTYPNVPEPAPGMLDMLQSGQKAIGELVNGLQENIKARFATNAKLVRFLGHLEIDQEIAPQLLTRTILDKALEKHGDAIRRELDNRIAKFETVATPAVELADEFRALSAQMIGRPTTDMRQDYVFEIIVAKLGALIIRDEERVAAEERDRSRPSRLALIRSIITGQPPNNGHDR